MRRIGIMGGTFNPIHNGHLAIAERAREQFLLEQVLFLPSGVPYKKDLRQVLPVKTRCEMVSLALMGKPYFTLSLLEVSDEAQGKNTYTYKTLEKLRQADPEAAYYFILGADSLFDLEHWKHPEQIFALCTVVTAARTEDMSDRKAFPESMKQTEQTAGAVSNDRLTAQILYLRKKYQASIALLEIDEMDISSTQIRELVSAGRSIYGLVPEAVETYIAKHRLYQKNEP